MNEKKFDGMGKIYSKYRPSYAEEFIDYLYSEVGLTEESVIADIGSGTGILTKQLLARKSKVFAVEPNDDMREIAQADLKHYKNFVSVNATAENTSLQPKSVDFITVAQAFHWFDVKGFKAECERILKPDGKVILVWNCRDEESKMVIDNDEVNRRFCPDFKGFTGGTRGNVEQNVLKEFFSGGYEERVFDNDITYEIDGFLGRNMSSSYSLKENDDDHAAYLEALEDVFDKHSVNGVAIMPNFTQCYVGRI